MRPEISVVVPTRDRPESLATLIAGLAAQTLAADRFELIVVDDGSMSPLGSPTATVLRRERSGGPGAARNTGWRAARAPLVAFIDDDCQPAAEWLTALLATAAPHDGDELVIQGPVQPEPARRDELRPLSHTIEVRGPDRLFACCNITYSRALLERLGGFDERLKRSAEDVDLGTRAIKAGARQLFAPAAVVSHEIRQPGLRASVRHTLKWTDSVRVLAMHPELRELLVARVFWKRTHPWLLLGLLGLASRRRPVALAAWLPYLRHYHHLYGGRRRQLAAALPVHLTIDLAEVLTVSAGSVRYRSLML